MGSCPVGETGATATKGLAGARTTEVDAGLVGLVGLGRNGLVVVVAGEVLLIKTVASSWSAST